MATQNKRPPRLSWISELGDDLLVEIVIRSSPDLKSASRCKAVCKRWKSLISSPCFNRRFVSEQQNKKKKIAKLLLQNTLVSVISSFLPPVPGRVRETETLHVLDCFEDMVLCGVWDPDRGSGRPRRMLYFICNPFTEKWIAIPVATTYLPDWYPLPVARLVCEPSISTNLDLGGGDDGQQVIAYEYRFRVVCMYHDVTSDDRPLSITMDLFCSESGEWIRRTPTLPYYMGFEMNNVRSCNGELFWAASRRFPIYPTGIHSVVARFNPFRPDIHPSFIETCTTTLLTSGTSPMLTVSQDAVYLIQVRENKKTNDDDDIGFVIWRLDLQEYDGKHSWRKQREVSVKTMKKNKCWCGCERKAFVQPILHPSNPDIVFLVCSACRMSLYSLDFSREEEGEMKLFGKLERVASDPYIDYYPNAYSFAGRHQIPAYKELPEHRGSDWM